MTPTMPFAFKDLAGEPAKARGKRSAESPCRHAGRCDAKTFMPLFPDAETVSEPKVLYTAEELARAVEDARNASAAETEIRLQKAMADDIERCRNDLLSAIGDQLARHRSAYDEALGRSADICFDLAMALADAVVPRALEQHPLDDIAELLRGTLARLSKEPSVELRLSPDLVEVGEELLVGIVKDAGFPGDVAVTADPKLGKHDAALRWHGGTVERRIDRLRTEARDLVDRWLPEVRHDGEGIDAAPSSGSPQQSTLPDPSDHPTQPLEADNERATS